MAGRQGSRPADASLRVVDCVHRNCRRKIAAVAPSLTIVVVVYGMARELPRTLRTLAPPIQRDIATDEYEVVVVDNGTPGGLDLGTADEFGGRIRLLECGAAAPSPARAANRGLALADGDLVGLIVDGARMVSPRLLSTARLAGRLAARPVITSPAYHLGASHMDAAHAGYDQRVEDELLASVPWEDDGYELFGVSTLANSSGRGWFGPMGESSALFMPRELWHELGGLDERFTLPGGGLVNHDLFRRACALAGVQLIVLLGEGTFHQFHGGAATTGRYTWAEMHREYESLRGGRYEPPENEPLYVGRMPAPALPHVARSVELAVARQSRLRSSPRTT
jgi:hypothetical protein